MFTVYITGTTVAALLIGFTTLTEDREDVLFALVIALLWPIALPFVIGSAFSE